MSASGPAVLVMARAPRPGQVRRALEPLLGPAGCAALQALLIKQAVEWGRALVPDAVHVAHEPPDAGAELRSLVGDVSHFPQNGDGIAARVAAAAARVFANHAGPLLIIWPDLACLRPDHGTAAIEDIEAGCDLCLGPVIDGGFYLVAMARPLPQLFALPEQGWRSPDAVVAGLVATREAGLELGILRSERALHRPADVRAALADPLLCTALAEVLAGPPHEGGPGGSRQLA